MTARKHNRRGRIAYYYIFALLFTSVDTVIFGTNKNVLLLYVPRVVAGIGVVLIPFISAKRIKLDRSFCFLLLFILIVAISGFSNGSDFNSLASRVLFIFIAFLIIAKLGKELFFKCFDDFLFFISVFALLLEIIAYIFPGILSLLPTVVNTSGSEFCSIVVSSIMKSMINTKYIRCSSIFWEPGAYATYLLIGLINELYIQKTINLRRVIVYSFCLFLTFSTAGIVAFVCLIISVLFFNSQNLSKKVKKTINSVFLFSLLTIVFFCVIGRNTKLYDFLFSKIINNNSSARTRWASLIVPFYIAFDFPFFGAGPNLVLDLMRVYADKSSFSLQASNMLTNTITYQIATYGFIFGFLFFIGIVLFAKKCVGKNKLSFFILVLTIVLSFFAEAFFSFIPFILVFYGTDREIPSPEDE